MGFIGGQRMAQIGIDLFTDDVRHLQEFYQNIFDAEETYGFRFGNGKLAAIGLRIANAHFRIIASRNKTQARQDMRLTIYVPDAEWVVEEALTYGARLVSFLGTSEAKLTIDMVTGDRAGRFHDPAGYLWEVRTRLEAVSAEEALSRVRGNRPELKDGLSVA